MADITDKFGRPSATDAYAPATTVKTQRTAGVTVLECNDLSKFATDTPVYFLTYKKEVDPLTDEVAITSQTGWKGLVNIVNNTITNLTVAPGYVDGGNDIDDFVECIPSSYWGNDLVDGMLVSHNPDGTLKDSAVPRSSIDTAAQKAVGLLGDTKYYTTAGANTWTKPGGLKYVIVEVLGGGASGGNTETTTSTQASSSGGGGGGGYARKKILAANLGATETVTVGAGANDNSGAGADGLRGGHSLFGSHCTGEGGWGGIGGTATTANAFSTGGNGGAAFNGDLNIRGQRGGHGEVIGGSRLLFNHGGGTAITPSLSSSTAPGGSNNGESPGQGGSGTTGNGSTSASRGGKGYKGIVIVHEYF